MSKRYLTPQIRVHVHGKLVTLFMQQAKTVGKTGTWRTAYPMAISELPYHLIQAGTSPFTCALR